MQSINGVVVAYSKNGWMNDDVTADWLQKVVGKFNFGPRLLVWESYRCHINQATKQELKPFKASLHESYDSWIAGNVDKTYTAGGNLRAPARRLLVTWVLKDWEELDTELVKKSAKVIVCVGLFVCGKRERVAVCV